jgi:hypothetical protein
MPSGRSTVKASFSGMPGVRAVPRFEQVDARVPNLGGWEMVRKQLQHPLGPQSLTDADLHDRTRAVVVDPLQASRSEAGFDIRVRYR